VKRVVRFFRIWIFATLVAAGTLAVGAGLAILGDWLHCRLLIGVCLVLAMTGAFAWTKIKPNDGAVPRRGSDVGTSPLLGGNGGAR